MVVKLQRPNAPYVAWTVNDKDRTIRSMIEDHRVPAHVRKAMGDAATIYFEVTVRNGKVVEWLHRTVTQPW